MAEGCTWPYLVVDYFFQRVPDTPENRARMVRESIVTPETVVAVVRAARSLQTWYPGYERYRSRKA
jgi:hypothetical protein